MKSLFAICLIAIASLAWAADKNAAATANPHQSASLTGEVLEVKNVADFTYLRLKSSNGETWVAVIKAAVKKGETVTIENFNVMNNFHSKTLNRTFPTILFGNLAGPAGAQAAAPAAPAMMPAAPAPAAGSGHSLGAAFSTQPKAKLESINDAPVAKASGANAYTVAEIVGKSAELKDKKVVLRGKVVKYNAEIMGKNWLHLRDGSGNAADGSNDILVTSKGQAKVGDIVTASGTVRTDQDFGAGYAYKVLIEDAALK